MVFSVKGYHTCKEKNGIQYIRDNVPFISREDNQWLGQGYYFWTDSEYWARKWMNDPKVISKFSINLEKDKVLDLVGDVTHQELLRDIYGLFTEGSVFHEQYVEQYGEDISVGTIISFLRLQNVKDGSENFFPFWAVRAKDNRYTTKILFTTLSKKELFLVEPHQLCVYQEYKAQAVNFEQFVYPGHFC